MADLDLTQPGPAGLYRDPSRLTAAGWQKEMEARARLEPPCTVCGLSPAPYGLGRHRACEALSCRSEAETRMDADRGAVEAPAHAGGPSQPTKPTDLFKRLEAA